MACQEFHVGDIGTAIRVTVKDGDSIVDISSATTLQISFEKPSGTIVTKTASLYSDGTDGIMKYTTESGFLDEEGDWTFQGYVAIGAGSWHSTEESFTVYPNLGG